MPYILDNLVLMLNGRRELCRTGTSSRQHSTQIIVVLPAIPGCPDCRFMLSIYGIRWVALFICYGIQMSALCPKLFHACPICDNNSCVFIKPYEWEHKQLFWLIKYSSNNTQSCHWRKNHENRGDIEQDWYNWYSAQKKPVAEATSFQVEQNTCLLIETAKPIFPRIKIRPP